MQIDEKLSWANTSAAWDRAPAASRIKIKVNVEQRILETEPSFKERALSELSTHFAHFSENVFPHLNHEGHVISLEGTVVSGEELYVELDRQVQIQRGYAPQSLIPVYVPEARPSVPHGEWPTIRTTRYLLSSARAANRAERSEWAYSEQASAEAAEQVKRAVVNLFHSMAVSLRAAGTSSYVLGTRGHFADEVASAIAYRVSVSFSHLSSFAVALYEEVALAASNDAISGPFWKVGYTAGKLVLEVSTDATEASRASLEPLKEKAKVVGLSLSKRPT
jgi:hypothetical protein